MNQKLFQKNYHQFQYLNNVLDQEHMLLAELQVNPCHRIQNSWIWNYTTQNR